MRKIGIIAVLSLLVMALAAVPALAATTATATATNTTRTGGLHFTTAPTVTATLLNNQSTLTATGEVAGAGSTGGTANLSATATVTRGCLTPPENNEPSGLVRSTTTTSGTVNFPTTRNGRGSFTVSTTPITTAGFTCPSANMTPVLVSVTYSNIKLTVTSQTGTATATFPNLTVTR
jgi:hypothetical protein